MRVNTAKTKMTAGEPAFGFALELGSPAAAEVVAHAGVDFVLVDTQHGSFTAESAMLALMEIATSSAAPMARVAHNDYTAIGLLLDAGALGIVVPMVDTAEQARSAAGAARFPPRGTRSWGWGRAGRYGADYGNRIDEEIFLAVQIESAAAVDKSEAILETPGIDGCWIGPSDLALSLGIHPRDAAGDERHERAIASVLEACRNTGKIPGFAAYTVDEAILRARQGFRYLTAGCDLEILLAGTEIGAAQLKDFGREILVQHDGGAGSALALAGG